MKKLSSMIKSKKPLVIPGVYDAIGAKIAEKVGFDAMFQTGYGTSATLFGMPDYGFIGATETVDNARRISNAISIVAERSLIFVTEISANSTSSNSIVGAFVATLLFPGDGATIVGPARRIAPNIAPNPITAAKTKIFGFILNFTSNIPNIR